MRRVLIITAALLVMGCAKLQEYGPAGKEAERLPDQTISQGKIDVVKGGRVQYVIQAGRIRSYEKDQLTLLDSSVVVDFYNQAGQHTSMLTSDSARVEENKNVFKAEGNVVVRTDSGAVLRTERLFWDETTHRVKSDTLVTLVTNVDSLRGYNFESDENLSSWQIQQPTGQTMRKFKTPS